MESVHFPDSFLFKGLNGRSLKDYLSAVFDKLSLDRPPDSATEDGQNGRRPNEEPEIPALILELANYSEDAIYLKDSTLNFLWFNSRFSELFAIDRREQASSDIDIYRDIAFGYELKKREKRALLNLEAQYFSIRYLNKTLKIRLFPIKHGNRTAIGGFVTDVTPSKRRVDSLKRYIQKIQRECDRLKEMILIDPLTGIYNKKKFQKRLTQEISRAKRYKDPLSLILFDIDSFKDINDTHGHLIGDEVLKKVAKTVGKAIRKADLFARIGGDEFAIIAPKTDKESAYALAEKIRGLIENIEAEPGVTCSFGIAEYREPMEAETLITRADEALYRAKKSGKNRTSV